MVIVVAILVLAAAVALPSASPTNHYRLELAAARVADAFRFAREEARRTGLIHGVSADVPGNRIRVFRLDPGPDPSLKIYDVRHPVTRQPYSIEVDASPHTGVDLTSYGGQMVGVCNDPGHVAFDAHGVVRCTDPTTTRIRDAAVVLAAGQITSTVAIESYTGAVSVQ